MFMGHLLFIVPCTKFNRDIDLPDTGLDFGFFDEEDRELPFI
jgi:hypothetical protein